MHSLTNYLCPKVVQVNTLNQIKATDITNSVFSDDIKTLIMFRALEKDELTHGQALTTYRDAGVVNNVQAFEPTRSVTRAEFLKMLVRSLSCYYTFLGKDTPYSDVSPNDWYAEYIAFAQSKHWINGYSDNTFRPNSPITRIEAAKILINAIHLPLIEAQPSVAHNFITRAEAAHILS